MADRLLSLIRAVLTRHVHGYPEGMVSIIFLIKLLMHRKHLSLKAGPCSDNSGTLMFAEIETVLESSSVQEIFDEIAAVKYIVWDRCVHFKHSQIYNI